MASSGVNVRNPMLPLPSLPLTSIADNQPQVLRYGALFTGIGYGFYHQASIAAKVKLANIDRDFEHQASLISKAKAEWAKKTMPKEVKEGAGEFDFSWGERWLENLLLENPDRAGSALRSVVLGLHPGNKMSKRDRSICRILLDPTN